MPKAIIVTGSRNWPAAKDSVIHKALNEHVPDELDVVVAHGDCRGADEIAFNWCLFNDTPTDRFDADWDQHGKAAGPIRNCEMLDTYPQATVLAFPIGESRGTRHCIAQARKRGMKVVVYEG